jgi:hypothetical protein
MLFGQRVACLGAFECECDFGYIGECERLTQRSKALLVAVIL